MRPDQTKLALTLSDGSLTIMSFVTRGFRADGSVQFQRDVTPETVGAECEKVGLSVVSWRVIRTEDIPDMSDPYRNAWVDRGDHIDHDMAKARELCRERLRVARAPKLAALDVEYQRADEDDDREAKKRVAAEKRRLRDITADPRIDSADSIDGLWKVTAEL